MQAQAERLACFDRVGASPQGRSRPRLPSGVQRQPRQPPVTSRVPLQTPGSGGAELKEQLVAMEGILMQMGELVVLKPKLLDMTGFFVEIRSSWK
jgi:hypothetical protein